MVHRLANIGVLGVVYDLYMDDDANPYLTYDRMSRQDFEPIFRSLLETQTLYVAELNEEVIGTYRLIPKTHRQRHTVYLGGFSILKNMKGKGLGAEMLADIRHACVMKGIKRLELTVDINNPPALALYKKMGFEYEGTLRKSYTVGDTGEFYDEYLMALILD
jgi:RimJ/RimL family protein N-acetyltransferase